jgi:Na+-translocating ferredoxin:NAD+ oxidoreductase RNF subunit RnfB
MLEASGFVLSAAILGGVGTFFATVIALARKKLYVWEDPRIDAVTSFLPGANCGACGKAGCRAFAESLVMGASQPAGCTVASPDIRGDIASYLGVDVGHAATRVARLLCAGGCDVAPRQADYLGLQTCRAAAAVAGGGKACAWGCLSLADCRDACDFNAIYMNDSGLPVVIPEKCTACGDCVEACPKDLFTLMPLEQKLIVQCKNLLEGDDATSACAVACNTCGRCAADAAPGLIAMVNGLAVIDYDKNALATPDAIRRCPTGAIVWVEGAQALEPADRDRVLEGAVS